MQRLNLFVGILVASLLLLPTSCVSKEYTVTETYYETEYRTEYKTQTYTETKKVVVDTGEGKDTLMPKVKWYNRLYTISLVERWGTLPSTYYYGYEVDPGTHSRSEVTITVTPGAQGQNGVIWVYDLTGLGQIAKAPTPMVKFGFKIGLADWLDDYNETLASADLLGSLFLDVETDGCVTFDADGIQEFAILAETRHSHSISGVQLIWFDEVIEEQTVTKEREVPYEIAVEVEKQRTVTKTKELPFWEFLFTE